MRHLSLFSGVGGIDLGFDRAGMTTVGQVEIDPFCRTVLERHWPDVWRWDDIATLEAEDMPAADVISAGFPCQPTSVAGKRKHDSDERWLWPEVERVVGFVRPRWVVLENPTGILSLGFGDIADGLARLGYDFRWDVLSACRFGAPHTRARVFVVAHAAGFGWVWGRQDWQETQSEEPAGSGAGTHWSAVSAPEAFGMAHGVPSGLDRSRLRALGNAVVPQAAEWVGRRIMEVEHGLHESVL